MNVYFSLIYKVFRIVEMHRYDKNTIDRGSNHIFLAVHAEFCRDNIEEHAKNHHSINCIDPHRKSLESGCRTRVYTKSRDGGE